MNIHRSAKSVPASRLLLVKRVLEGGWSASEAAEAAGLSERSAYKWLRRFREHGAAGLEDRSSRPHRCPRATSEKRTELVLELRRCRLSGPAIADRLKMPRSTVGRLLKRHGLGKLKFLEPKEPANRYEHCAPGDLVHLDVKKLNRFSVPGHRVTGDRSVRTRNVGWDFVHVAIDDYTRLAYVEVLDDERTDTAQRFLKRAVAWFERRGVTVRRLLTDNGSCYVSYALAELCAELGIKHSFTRPYRPRTNGKAERFIQTLLREWAYVRPYRTSDERNAQLGAFVRRYNYHRPHGSLDRKPPSSRLRKRRRT